MVCVGIYNEHPPQIPGLGLWNPATRDFYRLPTPDPPLTYRLHNYSYYGFCYDSLNDDYKILRIYGFKRPDGTDPEYQDYNVDMYSWRSNSWKIVSDHNLTSDVMDCIENAKVGGSVGLDGTIFWPGLFLNPMTSNVVSFEFSDETFVDEDFPLPNGYDLYYCGDIQMDVYRGCLALFLIHLNPNPVIDVWVMEEEENSENSMSSLEETATYSRNWFKLMTCPYYDYPYRNPVYVISDMNGEVGLRRLICYSESEGAEDDFVLYDVYADQSLEKYVYPNCPDNKSIYILEARFYVESLVSPHPKPLEDVEQMEIAPSL